jgi:hypothetical protein
MSGKILIDCAGWIGSLLVVIVYALNIVGKLKSSSPIYLWGNVVGSIGLVVNTCYMGAYPSTVVNLIWIVIAVWGIFSRKNNNVLNTN